MLNIRRDCFIHGHPGTKIVIDAVIENIERRLETIREEGGISASSAKIGFQ